MYKIDNISGTQSAQLEPCLQCKKTLATAPALSLEVRDDDGTLLGYLHRLCRAAWEEAHPSAQLRGERERKMIHAGDVVEEVVTKRRGEVNDTRASIVNGQKVTSHWQVHFSDGKDPVIKLFQNEEKIRLVRCPHETSEPGFYPSRSIMEP
jgi:hypothetical protein